MLHGHIGVSIILNRYRYDLMLHMYVCMCVYIYVCRYVSIYVYMCYLLRQPSYLTRKNLRVVQNFYMSVAMLLFHNS